VCVCVLVVTAVLLVDEGRGYNVYNFTEGECEVTMLGGGY
jgi:putative component of toxin-antitoxin plasmid stabilization module